MEKLFRDSKIFELCESALMEKTNTFRRGNLSDSAPYHFPPPPQSLPRLSSIWILHDDLHLDWAAERESCEKP